MSSISTPPEWRSQAENSAETSRRREVVPETGRRERPSRGRYAELFELLRTHPLLRTQVMNTGIAAWEQANRRRVRFQWRGYTLTIYSTFCRFCVDDYRGRELCCRYH